MRQIGDTAQEPRAHQASKQEGVRIGNVLVLAQRDEEALNARKQRLLAHSYRVRETTHFVICQQPTSQQIVLLHRFGQAEIDADLICFIEDELPPRGVISSEREFGATLFAVLASTFPAPRSQPVIWRQFCLNTLAKLRQQIAQPLPTLPPVSYIAPFAAIYRQVFADIVGQRILDVGCSFGFLPLLMAERIPGAKVVGCDCSPDAINFARDLAEVVDAQAVTFTLQDVLDISLLALGSFETVTAIHLLEHLAEDQMPLALTHLLQVTSRRLIIAVPYEEQMQGLYGHRQVFTPATLQRWGQWCVEALDGRGRYWIKEVMGGLLVVERS